MTNEIAKWCRYCNKAGHDDSECWSTRPAGTEPRAFVDVAAALLRMPGVLPLDVAARIGNEHRVSVGAVQSAAKAVSTVVGGVLTALDLKIEQLQQELGECQVGRESGTRAIVDNLRLQEALQAIAKLDHGRPLIDARTIARAALGANKPEVERSGYDTSEEGQAKYFGDY